MGRCICGEPIKTRRGPIIAGRCCKPTAPPRGGGRVVIQTSVRQAPTFDDGFPICVPHGTGGGPFPLPHPRFAPAKVDHVNMLIDGYVRRGRAKGAGRFGFAARGEFSRRKMLTADGAQGIISPNVGSLVRPYPSVGPSMIPRKTDPGHARPARPTCSPARYRNAAHPVTLAAGLRPAPRWCGRPASSLNLLFSNSFADPRIGIQPPPSRPRMDCRVRVGRATDQGTTAGRVIRGTDAPGSRHYARGSGRASGRPLRPGRPDLWGSECQGCLGPPWRPA